MEKEQISKMEDRVTKFESAIIISALFGFGAVASILGTALDMLFGYYHYASAAKFPITLFHIAYGEFVLLGLSFIICFVLAIIMLSKIDKRCSRLTKDIIEDWNLRRRRRQNR